MKLAVIPARGGSKRIPRKNIRDFCGRPMIAWPIEAALESGCFDRVVVSTDDAEIAAIARREGADVPFMRPAELADDHAPTRPVINHAITFVEGQSGDVETVCCIYPTTPFVDAQILRDALDRLQQSGADFVFAAAGYAVPIQWAFRIVEDGSTEWFNSEHWLTRSQDLEPAYHDAGQFYWGKAEAFLADRDMVSRTSLPYVMPRARVHDIDTPEDWELAALVFRAMRETGGTA